MDKILIKGQRPLNGEVKISGAKNAALPILFSSLLTDGCCKYTNVPHLRDINTVKLLLSSLGANTEIENNTIYVDTKNLNSYKAPYDLVRQMRASILVLGPLLARFKKAKVSLPGGCAIGARPINLHLKGLALLGANIQLKHGYVTASVDSTLKGADIYLDIPTVTGTENLMMAAALAEGKTVIRNAAKEPEIVSFADVLIKMGANIEGAGTTAITINGVPSLNPVDFKIMPDRIEAGTFMVAAAITNGNVKILDCEPDHLNSVIYKLRQAGAQVEVDDKTISVKGSDEIKSVIIKTAPFPGFPTDMQAQFMVLASCANNTSMISENVFENRFIHVSELKRLGADITISRNTAMIKGVPKLFGAQVMATDLRASASLVLAGLIAQGTTEINRIYHLDRGYDKIEEKLSKLDADIKRVK